MYTLTGSLTPSSFESLETLKHQLQLMLESSNNATSNGIKTAADKRQLILFQNQSLNTLAQIYGKILSDHISPIPSVLIQLNSILDQGKTRSRNFYHPSQG